MRYLLLWCITSNHHGWSHRGLLLQPFALHCLRTAIAEPPSGRRRLAAALEPGNYGSAPGVTTTRRVFERDERVRALVQIYQGTQRDSVIEPVSVRRSILDAKAVRFATRFSH
jgi:hypothetical protein